MALLGKAALAMWWDVAPEIRTELQDWHSHEHFRERLALPGFRRATRWSCAEGGEGVFQIYELEAYEIVHSPAYLASLNAPTPWSRAMMPHHRNMVRSQCRVLESAGGNVARHALTLRLSPQAGADDALRATLARQIAKLPDQAGCVGAHLLRHEAPPIAQTTEQKIRGGDRVADWVLIVVGYDAHALSALADADLSPASLEALGAQAGTFSHLYTLSFSATPQELA